jgi:beta-glucosidase-like glycosyl hydrolase
MRSHKGDVELLRVFAAGVLLATRVCVAFAAVPQQIRNRLPEGQEIGQLLLVGFDGPRVSPDLRRLTAEWHVGGVVLYAQNIESPEQVVQLNAEIRHLATAGVEPFLAVDQEGGSVRRLRAGVPQLPGAMAFGAARSPELARDAGAALAGSLRALGFTMNFAPVLDVYSNPGNTALGTRVFSSDAELVAALGSAFIDGEMSGGVIPVAKHFPGQGGTSGDSHYGLPVLDASRAELDARELVPFRAAIAAGVPGILTAHIAVPRVAEGADVPATLSHRLLTDVLRKDLWFQGLVITDELQMRAVQGHRKIGDVAVDALLAGADMVMVVWDHRDREEIYAALKDAYASGRLPHAVVNRALRHILAAKKALASHPKPAPLTEEKQVRLIEHLAHQAVTADAPNGFQVCLEGLVFVGQDGALRQRFSTSPWIPTPPRVDDEVVERALRTLSGVKTVIAAVASENDRALIVRLRRELPTIHLIVVCLGSPQLLAGLERPEGIIYAYSDLPPFQTAVGNVLLDGAPALGVLPVPPPLHVER